MAVNFLTSGWSDIEQWLGFGGNTRYTKAAGVPPPRPGGSDALAVTSDPSADSLRFPQADPLRATKALQGIGLISASIGAVGQAFGAYYATQAMQGQYRSQALSYQYQSDIAKINARSAEYDAQSILESSKTQIGQYTMQAGQAKASAKTEMAGRGLVLGEGSTREVEASMDLVKDVNVMTLNSNAVRAAEAERTIGTNYKNQAMLDDVSAANARRSADSVSPFGNAFGTLLSSASSIGMTWMTGQQRQLLTNGGY